MARMGVETKLIWKSVPQVIRQQVAVALGAPVVRATRVWGGYSPTPTYRLVLADGLGLPFWLIAHGDRISLVSLACAAFNASSWGRCSCGRRVSGLCHLPIGLISYYGNSINVYIYDVG